MTGAAEVRISGRGGLFVADAATIDGPWLHVSGRWRTRAGANHSELRYSDEAAYTWPASEVAEIRWREATA